MNLSQQLCKVCGIEPRCIDCGQTVSEENPCPDFCSKQKYPDFEIPENFVKLFSSITTIEDFTYSTGCYYIPQIPTYKQCSHLVTPEGDYESESINVIKAFLECVIKCAVKEKNTADYIKRTEWDYE